MSDVTVRKGTTLPTDFMDKLSTGIAEARASTRLSGGGKPLLRLLKTGIWVWGQTNEPMQDGSRWVVDITTLQHGWVCWVDGELKGEILVSMLEPKPVCPQAIGGVDYKDLRAFELWCFDGDDEGTEVAYKVNSLSGMQAIDGLLQAIQRRIAVPSLRTHLNPVLKFEHSSYDHPKYGQVTTPVYDIVDWADMEGGLASVAASPAVTILNPEPAAPAKKPAKPAKPTKAPLTAAQEAPTAPAEPKSTTQAHVGQRRRPPAR